MLPDQVIVGARLEFPCRCGGQRSVISGAGRASQAVCFHCGGCPLRSLRCRAGASAEFRCRSRAVAAVDHVSHGSSQRARNHHMGHEWTHRDTRGSDWRSWFMRLDEYCDASQHRPIQRIDLLFSDSAERRFGGPRLPLRLEQHHHSSSRVQQARSLSNFPHQQPRRQRASFPAWPLRWGNRA